MRSDDETVDARRDAMRDALREASRQRDDAPAARVRAAVLSAAARAVDAPPLRAVTDAADPSHVPFRSRRWPLSAAALLVVSVMTGLVATRVMRDEPERVTTIAAVTPQRIASQPAVPVAPAANDGAAPVANPPSIPWQQGGESSSTGSRAAAPAARRELQLSRPTASRDVGPMTQSAPRVTDEPTPFPRREAPSTASSPQAAMEPRRAEAVPAPDRSAFVAPPLAASPSAPASKATGMAADSATANEASPARAASEAPRANPSMIASRARIGRAVEPASPEAWVARIVKLRADGDEAEADRELEGLRQRYPGFEVPAEALRPTGTR